MKGQARPGKRPAGKGAHLTVHIAAGGSGNNGKERIATAASLTEGKERAERRMEIRKEYFPLVLSGRK
ncbi:MAG: hypothetical protein AABY45_04350 [Deltaproteobacteria bacterium]